MYRDPSLPLQDAVHTALSTIANVAAFYDVPDNQPLPYVYFGDDDISPSLDAGDFVEATVNIEVFARDKIEAKTLVAQVVQALNRPLVIDGFSVMEWFPSAVQYRVVEDGMTIQASVEFDYLIQPT